MPEHCGARRDRAGPAADQHVDNQMACNGPAPRNCISLKKCSDHSGLFGNYTGELKKAGLSIE